MRLLKSSLVLLVAPLCLFPFMSPGLALILGVMLSYFGFQKDAALAQVYSKKLLAWSIVGLGATVNIAAVMHESVGNFKLTIISLLITIGGGWLLGQLLGISASLRALIACGTAICGATAIAAVGESIRADKEEMSLSLGVVLVLNGIALFLFPYLGHMLDMTPHDFGVWVGLAVHDTSSVVGAALQYSPESLPEATTVKLARAIWIAPLAVFFAMLLKPDGSKVKMKLPWFIGGFVIAAAVFSFVPMLTRYAPYIAMIARKGFVFAIFLLGTTINLPSLKRLGIKPLMFGVFLWILSSVVSLYGILG